MPFVFIVGTLFGSFFNVCIYRIPTGQSLSLPGSYCYACGVPIRWFDNVPIVSYFLLRGRCRSCRTPFSPRYALIELLTGLLFLAVFLQYRFCWPMLTYLAFTGLLLVATFTDFDHWIIPDRISWGGAALGLLLALALAFLPPVEPGRWIVAHAGPAPAGSWWGPLANALVGAAAGGGVLWTIGVLGSLAFRTPAMGLGDSKLLLVIGAFCGWQIAILSIFLGSVFGTVQGLWILLADRLDRRRASENSQDEAARGLQDIEALLDDDSEAARRRGWTFGVREKAVLTRILAAPRRAPRRRRHLKFGPHLALAAWLLMLFERPVMAMLIEYFAPLTETFQYGGMRL